MGHKGSEDSWIIRGNASRESKKSDGLDRFAKMKISPFSPSFATGREMGIYCSLVKYHCCLEPRSVGAMRRTTKLALCWRGLLCQRVSFWGLNDSGGRSRNKFNGSNLRPTRNDLGCPSHYSLLRRIVANVFCLKQINLFPLRVVQPIDD